MAKIQDKFDAKMGEAKIKKMGIKKDAKIAEPKVKEIKPMGKLKNIGQPPKNIPHKKK